MKSFMSLLTQYLTTELCIYLHGGFVRTIMGGRHYMDTSIVVLLH
jgi:hypothetical protein